MKMNRAQHHRCKHIAKAAQVQAQTKALSNGLQSQRRAKLFLKNFPTLQKNKTPKRTADTE